MVKIIESEKVKRWFLDECFLRGHGLINCETVEAAEEVQAYLEGYLRLPYTSCIVRGTEVNVYIIN